MRAGRIPAAQGSSLALQVHNSCTHSAENRIFVTRNGETKRWLHVELVCEGCRAGAVPPSSFPSFVLRLGSSGFYLFSCYGFPNIGDSILQFSSLKQVFITSSVNVHPPEIYPFLSLLSAIHSTLDKRVLVSQSFCLTATAR